MSLTLKLSDEEATLLHAKAAAEGLSLEEWLRKLAQPDPHTTVERPLHRRFHFHVGTATLPKNGSGANKGLYVAVPEIGAATIRFPHTSNRPVDPNLLNRERQRALLPPANLVTEVPKKLSAFLSAS